MGEVFKLNHCYNVDCLPAMELFPDNYFDLAVVDPPYFSGPERRGFYGSKVSKIGVHRDYPVSPAWSKPEPEYFRELYARKTDLNVVLFYDVSDVDDTGRYDLIKGHLQTRAVENVSTIVSVDSIHPYQTAPTAVFGKSGQILKECTWNQPELLIYDFEKTEDDFGETGRRRISDAIFSDGK